jgi:hypothetical protein
VYICGYERNLNNRLVAKYWKNGVPVNLTDGTKNADAKDIFILGTDIYIAGYEVNDAGRSIGKYWKNGIPANITDENNNGELRSIHVTSK